LVELSTPSWSRTPDVVDHTSCPPSSSRAVMDDHNSRSRTRYGIAARQLFLASPLYVHLLSTNALHSTSFDEQLAQAEHHLLLLHRKKIQTNVDLSHRAEALVDAFLVRHYHYQCDAIPWDYLDTPPASLDLVRSNLNTLLHVTSEVFLPTSLVAQQLITPFVVSSWDEALTPLQREMMDARETLLRLEQQQQQPSSVGKMLVELHKDLLYVERVHALDEFLEGRVGKGTHAVVQSGERDHNVREAMSDYVTMSGIIIGRLHRLENEHRTVVEHWSRNGQLQKR
jgi:hypothetical protein